MRKNSKKGQIHFTKFALFILIYVKKLELIQVAIMVRYPKIHNFHLPADVFLSKYVGKVMSFK